MFFFSALLARPGIGQSLHRYEEAVVCYDQAIRSTWCSAQVAVQRCGARRPGSGGRGADLLRHGALARPGQPPHSR